MEGRKVWSEAGAEKGGGVVLGGMDLFEVAFEGVGVCVPEVVNQGPSLGVVGGDAVDLLVVVGLVLDEFGQGKQQVGGLDLAVGLEAVEVGDGRPCLAVGVSQFERAGEALVDPEGVLLAGSEEAAVVEELVSGFVADFAGGGEITGDAQAAVDVGSGLLEVVEPLLNFDFAGVAGRDGQFAVQIGDFSFDGGELLVDVVERGIVAVVEEGGAIGL